jgi:predicted transcriptional regulator
VPRRLKIAIGDAKASAVRVVEAWHRAKRGCVPDLPEERLGFEDLEILLRALTPRRWALLKALRRKGPSSVLALARSLGRDYKNVHGDVKLLETLGLVVRADRARVAVPWEIVTAEIALAA